MFGVLFLVEYFWLLYFSGLCTRALARVRKSCLCRFLRICHPKLDPILFFPLTKIIEEKVLNFFTYVCTGSRLPLLSRVIRSFRRSHIASAFELLKEYVERFVVIIKTGSRYIPFLEKKKEKEKQKQETKCYCCWEMQSGLKSETSATMV